MLGILSLRSQCIEFALKKDVRYIKDRQEMKGTFVTAEQARGTGRLYCQGLGMRLQGSISSEHVLGSVYLLYLGKVR